MIRRAHQIGYIIAVLGGVAAPLHAQEKAPAPQGAKAPKAVGAGKAAKGAPSGAPAAEKPVVLTEADLKRRAQPLVTYKGGEVTVGELEDAIAQQSPFMRERYRDPKNLQELLDKTLRFELLSDEAGRRGADKNEAVRQAVKQNAVQLLMKVQFDDKLSAEAVPAADIAKYYQDHIDEYVQPAMQRSSHVKAATEAEAKALLEQAKSMDLRAFRQLARDKSIDEGSKLRGGDLRYFDAQGKVRGETDTTVPAPIVKAAFALKTVGDTAPAPVKVDGGYSIVKLTGQRPAVSRKLNDVEETIRVRLWREQRQNAIDAFVTELRTTVKPETHPELVELVKLEDASGPAKGAAAEEPAKPEEGEGPHMH
jgi:peptidyl-prolyl cis-trans isomerase C